MRLFKFIDLPEGLRAISRTREISWAPKRGNKGLADILQPYRGNDELRPVMSKIYVDEHGITATDAHKLFHVKADLPESEHGFSESDGSRPKPETRTEQRMNRATGRNETYTVTEDVNTMRYPNYMAVIPRENPRKYTIDMLRLESYAEAALHYANKTTHQIPLSDREGDFRMGVNGRFLLTVIKSMRQMGHDHADLHCSQPNRAMIFTPVGHAVLQSVSVLLMPVMLNDDATQYRDFPIDPDFEIGLGSGYDLRTNTVFNHDGTETTTWQVMEGWQPSGNVTRARLTLIKRITEKKPERYTRSILHEYAMVRNGVLHCAHKELHYSMPNCGLADGFYKAETEGMKPTVVPYHDEEPFDEFPRPFHFSTGNVLKWEVQELGDRLDISDIITGNDDLRPEFSGYNLQVKGGTLTFGSTDHYSAYYDRCKVPDTVTDFNVIMGDVREQKMFASIFDNGHIFMQMGEKGAHLLAPTGEKLTVTYIDAKYPDLAPVLEKHTRAEYDRAIIIDKKEVDTLEPIMRKDEGMRLHLPDQGTTAKLTRVVEGDNKKGEYKDAKDMPMRIVDMPAPNDKLVISFPVHGTVQDRPWIGLGKTVMQTLKKLLVGRAATDFTLHYPSSSEGVALIVTNPTLPDWPDDHLLGSAPQSTGVKVPTPPRAKTPPKQASLAEVVEVVTVVPMEVEVKANETAERPKSEGDLIVQALNEHLKLKKPMQFQEKTRGVYVALTGDNVFKQAQVAISASNGIIHWAVKQVNPRKPFNWMGNGQANNNATQLYHHHQDDEPLKYNVANTPDPVAIRARAAATALRLKLKIMQMKY